MDQLLAFGAAGRGRHSLSILLATMTEERGLQRDHDYDDLQRELDAQARRSGRLFLRLAATRFWMRCSMIRMCRTAPA